MGFSVCQLTLNKAILLSLLSPAADQSPSYGAPLPSLGSEPSPWTNRTGPQIPLKCFLFLPPIPVGVLGPWVKVQKTLALGKYGGDTPGLETQAPEEPFPRASLA